MPRIARGLTERIGKAKYSLIEKPPIDLPEYWTKYVDSPLTENEVWELRRSLNRQSPYGEEQWKRKIAEKLGLESTIRQWGRPRKNIKK